MPYLLVLVTILIPTPARAENPCRSGAYLELSRMNPDSLTNRQFVNLLKYREKCEEYEAEREEQAKKNLETTKGSDGVIWGVLLGAFVVLFFSAFRF